MNPERRLKTDIGQNGFEVSLNYFTSLPDVTLLANPQIVVMFKSLMKKDATTKEKSLEELLKAFENDSLAEDMKSDFVINAWSQVYAKLALDNARNVRILSHKVQAKYLSAVGKKYGKYLKTTLPIWIQGQFDGDKLVSKQSCELLYQSFDNNKEKVEEKIWCIFAHEILHYVTVCLTYEKAETLSDNRTTNADDSRAKYERMVNGALMMLNKLIGLINSQVDTQLDTDSMKQMVELLEGASVWDASAVAFERKTFNGSLANSFLALVKTVFQEDKLDKTSQNTFCSTISGKNLYKHVCKKFWRVVKLKPSSKSQDMVFGGTILQLWGTLIVLTRFSGLQGKKQPKECIWDAVAKYETRLLWYLGLGPCNSNEIYYSLVQNFLRLLFQNSSEFSKRVSKEMVKVFVDQLNDLASFEYKAGAIECVGVISELDSVVDTDIVGEILDTMTISRTRANGKQRWIKAISALVGSVGESKRVEVLGDFNKKVVESIVSSGQIDVPSYYDVLGETEAITDGDGDGNKDGKDGKGGNKVGEQLIELLGEQLEATEDEKVISRILDNLTLLITKHLSSVTSLSEITTNLGACLEKTTVSSVINYFFAYYKIEDQDPDFEVVEDILTKYAMLELDPSDFVKTLLLQYQSLAEGKSPLLVKHMNKLKGQTKGPEDWESVFKSLDDTSFAEALISLKPEEELAFLNSFNKQVQKVDLSGASAAKLTHLLEVCWNQYLVGKGFVKFVKECGTDVSGSLWDYLKKTDGIDHQILDDLTEDQFDKVFEKLDTDLTNLPDINKNTLAVSNPLGANIHLVEDVGIPDHQALDIDLVNICKIFSQYTRNGNDIKIDSDTRNDTDTRKDSDTRTKTKLKFYSIVLNQYLSDFIFQMDQDSNPDTLLAIQTIFLPKICISGSLAETLDLITGKVSTTSNGVLNLLVSKLDTTKGAYLSYVARGLTIILDNLSDPYTVKQFESLKLNLNGLAKAPLKLSVVLCGLSPLLMAKPFDWIRNFVVAEILGVNLEEEIETSGFTLLVLSNNFLSTENKLGKNPKKHAIPATRLRKVLLQIENWLESDASYEDSFVPMRCQLLKFLSFVGTDKSLIDELVRVNLSLIKNIDSYELRYFTFKYLTSHEIPHQDKLLEFLINNETDERDSRLNSMAVSMCQDMLQRCFNKVSFKAVPKDTLDKIYSLLISTKFSQIRSVCVRLLEEQISLKQQDLVVNYQLSRTKDEFEDDLSLPNDLLQVLKVDESGSSEFDESADFNEMTYFVCWYLVLHHFKDISFQMRNQYITQIKTLAILPKFLDLIFTVKEIDHIKVIEPFDTFDLNDTHTMMLHLYFLSCKYLGSEVQTWFNEIRNIQLKNEMDKFTTNHISKVLVSNMLKEVEDGRTSIVTDVMNIKINKVINEVRCVFEIDDQTMEMVVKISANFPLGGVTVEGPKRVGLKENQWKAWLLSSQRVISLTNGSIIEAIEVFKKNVDLHFSGFDECAICYSILHQDHSLPSKSCTTCSNKFHAACLYKWFKSSGSSTCPLCRQTFNFRK